MGLHGINMGELVGSLACMVSDGVIDNFGWTIDEDRLINVDIWGMSGAHCYIYECEVLPEEFEFVLDGDAELTERVSDFFVSQCQ